jgi:glutamate dehydrogenase (NADP+)
VKALKTIRRGRIREYAEQFESATFSETPRNLESNPMWGHRADCAFPSATQNEINGKDAENLLQNGVFVVCEGANMPTTADGVQRFVDSGILYAPSKAANAGGVAFAGLEMAQNSMRYAWSRKELDDRLRLIMKSIHSTCLEVSDRFEMKGNYVAGANIAGFLKVADAMLDQGVV